MTLQVTADELTRALAPHGLALRGGFVCEPGDDVPRLIGDRSAAVLWMVGQIGSSVWPAFQASTFFADGLPDPMDRWCKSIGRPLAERLDGIAIFPSDGPSYPPFLRWARRAGPVQPSPLGLLIDPRAGLWHAYRFALALPRLAADDCAALAAAAAAAAPDLCARCDGRPCLAACPVNAFSAAGYDVPACATHLHSAAGAACMAGGCLARHACPVGRAHRYDAAHAAFHMAHFARKHRGAALPGATG
jgi:hypothetical protein